MDQAIEDLLFLARRLKGIIDLEPTLAGISSLDNAKKEKEFELEKLRKAVSDETDRLASVKEEAEVIVDRTEEEVQKALAAAKAKVEDTQRLAMEYVDKAKAEAADIVKTAEAQAERAKDEVSKAKIELSEWKDKIASAVKEHGSLQAIISDLKSRFK